MWYSDFSRAENETLFHRVSWKIVKAYEQCDTSIRKVAARFDVSKAFVQKLLKQKQTTGYVQPKKQGGSLKVCYTRTTQLTDGVENILIAPC